ncbi:hypothetical protein TspCOW1_11640 [Thiohalobacter sp. COW1]|uniref:P-loop NTPase fold protein n=1 Tax=Thiohalobacter sp. COW1 TaxID=2795687 RepID=UPI001914EB9D|nr:P-loop NTPase fold protein [Thiohalobacter sp. COW1]BCO31061.1 hypothetical protein TspCOW1_11640 [Thiohalobacter sp. COW1]
MSFDIVKREIFRFLESKTPEVLAIKGAWGVGKTFTWNKLLAEAKNNNKIGHEKYSYVSLFGVNSLESFRYSIFEQQININLIGTEPSLETFKENWAGVSTSFGKKLAKLAGDLPYLNKFFPTVESITFLAVKDTLICIDDFERKGDSLKPKDILGVLSELKERKNCKIVLILNDESFDDEKLEEEYKKYKEKVIDIEMRFDPLASESVDIALNSEAKEKLILKEYIEKLKINNIRTIKKIERLSTLLSGLLNKYEPEVLKQTIHTLVLYSWCIYHKGEDVPTIEYLRNIGYKMFGVEDENQTEQEKLWKSILTDYGYQTTDELDLVILAAVESGVIDEENLHIEAEKLNKQHIAAKSDSSFEEAWRLYHDCFDDNEEEVIDAIYKSFKKNTKYITPINLNGTVRLFRDLGRSKQADELINHYIEVRKDEKKLFDLDGYAFESEIDDKKIIDEFSKLKDQYKEHKTVKEVLSSISGKDSWGGNDADVLANATVDEFYDLFKNEKGRHLGSWINTCLKFGRFTNASDRDKKIAENATEALLRIAKESKINARRVAKFGINTDDNK